MNEPQRYYLWDEEMNRVVMVIHGRLGYIEAWSSEHSPDRADRLNRMLGNTQAEVSAAVTCSMWGGWDRFNERVRLFKS